MNTTAGFTCSATATNAAPRSAVDLGAGAGSRGAAVCAAAIDSVAPLRLGRLSVDAKANPNTKAIATRVPNFNQSRVRTDIAVLSWVEVTSSYRRPRFHS